MASVTRTIRRKMLFDAEPRSSVRREAREASSEEPSHKDRSLF